MAEVTGAGSAPRRSSTPEARTVKSVARSVRMLKLMAERNRPLSLSDVARGVGMSKSAAYHMLCTLVAEDFVDRTQEGRYELSWGLWEVGASVARRSTLVRIARPHLDRLAKETSETVLLSIVDDGRVLYLDRDEISSDMTMIATTGRRTSFHANASGKVHLAFASAELIDATLASTLKSFTHATVTDPAQLRLELERIREQGYSTCWQEQEVGISSIAVPIRGYRGDVVAALAIAGPAGRVNRTSMRRHVNALKYESSSVAKKLGGAPGPMDLEPSVLRPLT